MEKNIKIIIGDWSIGKQMRNFISTPNLAIKRKLKTQFQVFNIDEFRTSCLNYITEESCKNLYLPDNKNKERKITHIHFSTGYQDDTVISGMRKTCEIFIEIDMKKAMDDGIKFYKSNNGVILSKGINNVLEKKYFKKIIYK